MEHDPYIETRTTHYFRTHGRTFAGYGSSMCSHRCGDPCEPCWTVTEERTVTPWMVVSDSRNEGDT